MAVRTKPQLRADIDQKLADNTEGDISAQDVHDVSTDIVDSASFASGVTQAKVDEAIATHTSDDDAHHAPPDISALATDAALTTHEGVAGAHHAKYTDAEADARVAMWARVNSPSGVAPVARLGSGTPGATNFLRGDGTWEAPAVETRSELFNATQAVTGNLALLAGDIVCPQTGDLEIYAESQTGDRRGGVAHIRMPAARLYAAQDAIGTADSPSDTGQRTLGVGANRLISFSAESNDHYLTVAAQSVGTYLIRVIHVS